MLLLSAAAEGGHFTGFQSRITEGLCSSVNARASPTDGAGKAVPPPSATLQSQRPIGTPVLHDGDFCSRVASPSAKREPECQALLIDPDAPRHREAAETGEQEPPQPVPWGAIAGERDDRKHQEGVRQHEGYSAASVVGVHGPILARLFQVLGVLESQSR